MAEPSRTAPASPWDDYADLWRNPRAIAPRELALWMQAVSDVGDSANAACAYTRSTAPCSDCGPSRPRLLVEAAAISLAEDLPRLLPLSVWYDTPVIHDHRSWAEERYDPSRMPMPWSLAAMDGKTPTESQRVEHVKEKNATAAAIARAKRIAADKGHGTSAVPDQFHPAVAQRLFAKREPTVTLGGDGDRLFLGAPPEPASADPTARWTQFTYVLDSTMPSLRFFDQRALAPFSPHFGLRLRSYSMFGRLQRDSGTDAVVVTFLEYTLAARLTLVFKQAHHTVHWYEDFDCTNERPSVRP